MSAALSATQRSTLRALCDTYVPSIKVPDDPTGFWARSASDLGVNEVLARYLEEQVPEPLRGALLGLLDALAAQGFVGAPQEQREKILVRLRGSSPVAAQGLAFYEKKTLLYNYGLPQTPQPNPNLVTYGAPSGQNPNWEVLGFPGPVSLPPHRPKTIRTLVPEGDSLTLQADVCVVGSGSGGPVIAARLAERGRRVVVLEVGGHYNSADFYQLELWGYEHLFWRGGATPSADGNVLLLAGGALGGGTEVNWMNCVRTPDLVRREWATQYGVSGVDTPEYGRYMDLVEARISASQQTSYFNDQNLRLREGCQRLGYLTKQTYINWDPLRFQSLMAGFCGIGDQTGAKQTSRRTFLLDAYRNGARVVVNCRADRILVEQGRAAGVAATWSGPQGKTAKVTVRAPQVVVACGTMESPALLLRSGIGGPAVGQYFHVHPGGAVYGIYHDKQRGWWGSPQTANCEQFTDTGDGYGFYLETPAFGPGFVASVVPWTDGRQHKEVMARVPYVSAFIWFLRDRGYGRVTIDQDGNAVPVYNLTDPTDQKNYHLAGAEAVRIQAAAGAEEILFSTAHRQLAWRRGQSLERFIATVSRLPISDGAQPIISAHQMSTCRMGTDPATSVADGNGELHDVKGVWIGDASALPTAIGANPMITIMAMAERTADRMSRGVPLLTVDAIPGMAVNVLRELVGLATNPASMLREMVGILANPMNMISLGQRLLSGQASLPPASTAPTATAGVQPGGEPPAGARR
jgi:choline dehydrogenase-like flavoprotein